MTRNLSEGKRKRVSLSLGTQERHNFTGGVFKELLILQSPSAPTLLIHLRPVLAIQAKRQDPFSPPAPPRHLPVRGPLRTCLSLLS